jgi:hypothetical protein
MKPLKSAALIVIPPIIVPEPALDEYLNGFEREFGQYRVF